MSLVSNITVNSGDVSYTTSYGDNASVKGALDLSSAANRATLPFLPSGSFGNSTPLHSSLQTFKYNDVEYSYKGSISSSSIVPDSPGDDALWVKEPVSDYIENYGGGVHVPDQTPAILRAIAAGVRRIILPKGRLRMSECVLPGYIQGLQIVGQGANQAYTGTTTLLPATSDQVSMFRSTLGTNGQDSVKFYDIQFDGEWTCYHGILQEGGAGWYYERLTGKGFRTWFIYSDQGLSRMRDIYCNATDTSDINLRATGGGVRVYSDSVLDTVEVYGGDVPLLLAAGGNRCTNIYCNGGYSTGAIALVPKDTNTNHINTALSNIYIGESTNTSGTAIPILRIEGNSVRRVQGVQISNAHFVHADTSLSTNMTGIRTDRADRIVMSSFDMLGRGGYASSSARTHAFIDAYNTGGITLSSGVIDSINGNCIRLTSSSCTVGAVNFNNWAEYSDGTEPGSAACRTVDGASRLYIGSDCVFSSSLSNSYAIHAANEFTINASILNLTYINANVILPANPNYSYLSRRPGGRITLVNTFS